MSETSTSTSKAIVAECTVLNLTPPSKVSTGICFLDHMIDQLTSHGQLGVALRCGIINAEPSSASGKRAAPEAPTKFFAPAQDYATGLDSRPHDRDIFIAAGGALGAGLKRVVEEVLGARCSRGADSSPTTAVFCCPLDEAFAECSINFHAGHNKTGTCAAKLEPYGLYAGSATGRKWVGRYRTELTPLFWSALAASLGCELSLKRVRGKNAHHVLESTFKSFARGFRAALDQLADGKNHGCAKPNAPPPPPPSLAGLPPSQPRKAERRRATKETTIEVRVDLDKPFLHSDAPAGGDAAWSGDVMTPTKLRASVQQTERIRTGIVLLDEILISLALSAGIEIIVHCDGDRHIDDHHTAEDVAITLGQCLHEALGDKAGLARMGCAEGSHEASGCTVRAVIDLSNRPHFESDLPLDEEYVGGGPEEEVSGDRNGEGTVLVEGMPAPVDALCGGMLSCEMLHHVFDSLTLETRATAHLELMHEESPPKRGHTLGVAMAAASAYGAALARAIRVDPRRRGAVASSKGTLSK